MLKPLHFIFGAFLLMILTAVAMASPDLMLSSGKIKRLTDKEIVIEYQGKTHSFKITKKTKLCVDGRQVDSWQKLERARTATVISDVDSKVATRIDDKPMQIAMSGFGGFQTIVPKCVAMGRPAKFDLIKKVQGLLANAGYNPGPTDGMLGPKTKGAIVKFQRDHEYPENPMVSEKLVSQLERLMHKK